MGRKMKIGLICSPGGHFFELKSLSPAFDERDKFWVTIDSIDTKVVLKGENVYYAYSPTTRNVINLIKNTILAFKVIKIEKPSVIISTGGPICIPFFYLGRLFGIKCIYIESLTRSNSLSLTGKIVYPITSKFLVQWESLTKKYKKSKYAGQLMT